jgi:hypothetical protein
MKLIGNPDTMSANPNDELQGELSEDNEAWTVAEELQGGKEFVERKTTWTVTDEAIHRGYNYSEYKYEETQELMREGVSLKAVLKNAYQEGFLHGFEHKFDDTNYEEKK